MASILVYNTTNSSDASVCLCADAFWDSRLSWNTPLPLLTECFQQLILRIVPALFFWIIFGFVIRHLRKPRALIFPNGTPTQAAFSNRRNSLGSPPAQQANSTSPSNEPCVKVVEAEAHGVTTNSNAVADLTTLPVPPHSWPVLFKMIAIILILATHVAEIALYTRHPTKPVALVKFLVPSLEIIVDAGVLVVMYLHHRRCTLNSAHLFCYWLLSAIAYAGIFLSHVVTLVLAEPSRGDQDFALRYEAQYASHVACLPCTVVIGLRLFFILLSLALNSFSDMHYLRFRADLQSESEQLERQRARKRSSPAAATAGADEPPLVANEPSEKPLPINPETLASFLSRSVFGWLWPLLVTGFRKTLEAGDLWNLTQENTTAHNYPKFDKAWRDSLAAWRTKQAQLKEEEKRKAATQANLRTPPATPSKKSPANPDAPENSLSPSSPLAPASDVPKAQDEQAATIEKATEEPIARKETNDSDKPGNQVRFEAANVQDEEKIAFLPANENGNGNGSDKKAEDANKPVEKSKPEDLKAAAEAKKKAAKEKKKAEDEDLKRYPPLYVPLIKVFGLVLLQAHFCKLVMDIIQYFNPMFLRWLIAIIENPNSYAWHGVCVSLLIFFNSMTQSLLFQRLFYISSQLSVRIKVSLISAIYRKSLTISPSAMARSTTGEIMNLMSVDVGRFEFLISYLWVGWSAPLQIIIGVTLLYITLGPSIFIGLIVMVVCFVINAYFTKFLRKFNVEQMKRKDKRIKFMNEILNGIKVLKLYAWEPPMIKLVEDIREEELVAIKKLGMWGLLSSVIWTMAPMLVMMGTFAGYVIINGADALTAEKAFTALALFNMLRFPLNMFPMFFAGLMTSLVSLRRISRFLSQPDIVADNVGHDQSEEALQNPIIVENGTFAWKSKDKPILENISFRVKKGELFAVVGAVGVGKSTLISAILGQTEKVSGRVNVNGSVAYVAQQPWIMNATLKKNMLFVNSFNDQKYQKTVEACALKPDLEMLPAGDMTEIGERGINLSGGQKQRVSLARAVYLDADLYFLDDPLSAVDVHVGKHIFDHVIGGPQATLREKTRVLVTHAVQYLPQCDRILYLTNQCGECHELGTYEELMRKEGSFARFIRSVLAEQDNNLERNEEGSTEDNPNVIGGHASTPGAPASGDANKQEHKTLSSDQKPVLSRTDSKVAGSKKGPATPLKQDQERENILAEKKRKEVERLIQEERNQLGSVKLSVYWWFIRSQTLLLFFLWFALFVASDALMVLSSIWLSWWTEDPQLKPSVRTSTAPPIDIEVTPSHRFTYPNSTSNPIIQHTNTTVSPLFTSTLSEGGMSVFALQAYYMGVFALFTVARAVVYVLHSLAFIYAGLHSARLLHSLLLGSVMKTPMSFFDTTPSGRIINRFSKDLEVIDGTIPQTLRGFLSTAGTVIQAIVVISFSTPWFLAVIIPFIFVYLALQRFFIPTSRQLKRIESTTRSPIFNHFSETLLGRSTIVATGSEDRFIIESARRSDQNNTFSMATVAANRWIAFYVDLLGNSIVFFSAILTVIYMSTSGITGSKAGLSVSYALTITSALNWAVRMLSEIETNAVSVERIQEYTALNPEKPWTIESKAPPPNWPSEGRVLVEKYSTRYREGLDLVLEDVSIDVAPRDKLGICGRTGAGKSSMALALFRLVEPTSGTIRIDGIDITDIGLHQLRSRLTILPQDPVIFSGSLRFNLDPENKFDDSALWQALEQVQLKEYFVKMSTQAIEAAKALAGGAGASLAAGHSAGGLEYVLSEGGSNLSVGQRQLLCLARALLRRTRVLVLDEATAAVDYETDATIQGTIRREFAECSVLTIAHRINTILDATKILVLSHGRVLELAPPQDLLNNKDSEFYKMAFEAGVVNSDSANSKRQSA